MKRSFVQFALVGVLVVPVAYADDHGCKVLLCLANPAGPRAVAECRPDIDQLFRDLARGRPFPTCDLASAPNSSGGQSWAQQGMSYYDPCPPGTTALADGVYAVGASTVPLAYGQAHVGIGEGDSLRPNYADGGGPLPEKVCVGNLVARTSVSVSGGDSYSTVLAGIYDQVATLAPQPSPRIIDIYVDSTLYRRVRW